MGVELQETKTCIMLYCLIGDVESLWSWGCRGTAYAAKFIGEAEVVVFKHDSILSWRSIRRKHQWEKISIKELLGSDSV